MGSWVFVRTPIFGWPLPGPSRHVACPVEPPLLQLRSISASSNIRLLVMTMARPCKALLQPLSGARGTRAPNAPHVGQVCNGWATGKLAQTIALSALM